MYDFPDVGEGLLEVLAGLGDTTLWLEYDFENTVRPGHPVIHIEPGQGVEAGLFRTDPVTVTVYATSRTEALDIAQSIRALLTSGPHGPEVGLLDAVDATATPALATYPHDRVTKVVASYEVDTRPM